MSSAAVMVDETAAPARLLVFTGRGDASNLAAAMGSAASVRYEGADAIGVLTADDVEVVLVDARDAADRPVEVCRRIRDDRGLRELPTIVLVSGESPRRQRAEALRAGADAVVLWNGDAGADDVADAVAAAARRHRRHRAALESVRRTADDDVSRLRQDLDALAYAVSHDLRAPLRSVDGFSAALADVLGADLDPKAADYVRRVRAAARRLGDMIEGLLELSRVSRAPFAPQETDLSPMIRRTAAEMVRRYPHAPTLTVPDRLDAIVDRDLAQRLFEHVLDNCCKFSPTRPAAIAVDVTDTAAGREYAVRDEGVGFDASFAEKLFRPFQRLHRAEDFPGIGMGLAVVRSIVERHGGRVAIDGVPSAGTTLRFTLAPPTGDTGDR